ncbi:LysR family glycine cleavage system transcriptional activator [Pelomonas saccharophila]|uniref:LysR family glycine cleavage system transcriptional activator n=1 Tax=Roseateles saccharophilus TaxID=304 RepID=A0ABU1YVU3_ROSSA|nr:LysR family transcriptional regulator [Roseateles saccharophilus]MDR7272989.1 LysR family glycine cleavage system transcriptional activator [Roseateles saccharophilus]
MALSPTSPLPLESLRVLAACVRHGNFSRAADELAITPTAVSQRMRALEEQLGVKLFGRHGPKLIVTERAVALAAGVEQALALMRTAVDDCRRARPPLRLTCAPTFAACWLVPRLAAYQALPESDAIALDAGQGLSPAGSFDVAIRSGSGPWPGYRASRLLAEQGTPMLSPRLGRPATVDELLALPLIPDPRWPAWLQAAGRPDAQPSFVSTRFPNYELEARAAVQGLGVALLSPRLFADLCERGELVAPFAGIVVDGPDSYWLLSPLDAPEPHFVQWLKAQFATKTIV